MHVPRPVGHAMQAMKPKEIIHSDFCFIGANNTDMKYVIIVKDDVSSYTWLYACYAADDKPL